MHEADIEKKKKRLVLFAPLVTVPIFSLIFWMVFAGPDAESPAGNVSDVKKGAQTQVEKPETFDERRERVDKDPVFYESKAKVNPVTAVDHYLLGRAYVLMGMKTAAKNSFDKAFETLSTQGIASDRALAADIVFGRTVTADDESFSKFGKQFIDITAKDREEHRVKEEQEANKGL